MATYLKLSYTKI